jgi:hypothetical protein
VAVNCLVSPRATDELRGERATETKVGAVTEILVEFVTLPRVAVTAVVP